jgi:hypothetical protein
LKFQVSSVLCFRKGISKHLLIFGKGAGIDCIRKWPISGTCCDSGKFCLCLAYGYVDCTAGPNALGLSWRVYPVFLPLYRPKDLRQVLKKTPLITH